MTVKIKSWLGAGIVLGALGCGTDDQGLAEAAPPQPSDTSAVSPARPAPNPQQPSAKPEQTKPSVPAEVTVDAGQPGKAPVPDAAVTPVPPVEPNSPPATTAAKLVAASDCSD